MPIPRPRHLLAAIADHQPALPCHGYPAYGLRPGRRLRMSTSDVTATTPPIRHPARRRERRSSMDNSDVMFGRDNDDLLIARRGARHPARRQRRRHPRRGPRRWVLGPVRRTDRRTATTSPSGRRGWNDAFAGEDGNDVVVPASPPGGQQYSPDRLETSTKIPAVPRRQGSPARAVSWCPFRSRLPRSINASCGIRRGLPAQGDSPASKGVETAYCATGSEGKVLMATLAGDAPSSPQCPNHPSAGWSARSR